jgi:GNAT superfamily N-acetyltransferase
MIREVTTDEEISATFSVMRQLRPHLGEEEYLETVEHMRCSGYRLAYSEEGGAVRCVAGFRVLEFLAHGRFLYVDDLITDEEVRSGGHGGRMLEWLAGEGRRSRCGHLQLDSGVQRHDAHRFYFREGMSIASFHFAKEI